MRIICALLFCLMLAGCSTMSNGELDRLGKGLKEGAFTHSEVLTVQVPYKQAFDATINVLHDLAISIPRKDFANKEIVAIDYGAQAFSQNGGSSRYLFSFQENGSSVTITVKTIQLVYNYDGQFIFERIQQELGIK